MTAPIDQLLSRLPDAKPNGRDRWRCACPVCGEKNKSTLSIGIGDNGCVLVRCWKSECGPDEIAAAVGLELTDLFPPRNALARPLRRRRLITATQALDLLDAEATLLFVVGSGWARGIAPDSPTMERITTAVARIGWLRDEGRT